jgi:hypothetical protein
VKEPRFERVCERGRTEFAIADEGPAKERGGAEAAPERFGLPGRIPEVGIDHYLN